MTNPLETNQKIPMIRRKIINETYSTKDLLIIQIRILNNNNLEKGKKIEQ